MRILQIHKYFSKDRGGGSVTAFFETKKLLEEKGHQVIVFSMDDPRNEESVYSKYFIKHFDIFMKYSSILFFIAFFTVNKKFIRNG